jgi:hypothetical protein
MSNLYHQINIGIRSDLVRAIKQRAAENRRTMKAELELILINEFSEKPKPKMLYVPEHNRMA